MHPVPSGATEPDILEAPVRVPLERLVDSSRIGLETCSQLMAPPEDMPSVSVLLHYLDFWSEYGRLFDDSEHHGRQLLSRLVYMPDSGASTNSCAPLFYKGQDGILRARFQQADGGEGHIGQTLAIFGKIGVPSSSRVRTEEGSCSVREAISGVIELFSLNGESDWMIATLAHYLPAGARWRNRWGEDFTFSDVGASLVNRKLGRGPCSGAHTLYLLALLLRRGAQQQIFDSALEAEMRARITDACLLLELNQGDNGGWGDDWWSADKGDQSTEQRLTSLHVTGHHLEWLTLCDRHSRLDEQRLRRAMSYCENQLRRADALQVVRSICEYEHAILCVTLSNDTSR